MPQVIEGKTAAFVVVGKNAVGRTVPVTGVTVTVDDANKGTATVNDDGSNGVFTAGSVDGDASIVAAAGSITSAPFVETVVADPVPVTLEISAA